jgi:hypothetical protein
VADWRELEVGNETRSRDINEIEDAYLEHPGGSATSQSHAGVAARLET